MALLLSRWMQSLLGTALLGGLVWVFGPLWPPLEPVLTRVLVLQSMLVVWAVANALLDWRRRAGEGALAAGLVAAAPGQEAAAVGNTLGAALKLLRKSGRRYRLAEQPWYAIIGPPGAGKTTALLNAGLSFTLAEQLGKAAIAGVGGTRLCEWWFTESAVLIDTAGRYTTQDSNAAVDRAGWEAFLALLKRTRPRQPLNGVIVAIALPEVVLGAQEERDAHAASIRQRIAELEDSFGLRLPVYLLFTKADLIAGFMEFFDDLDQERRDQVWGQTYAIDADGKAPPSDRFGAGFRALVAQLNALLLPRLQAERRVERRGLITGFPTQVASLERPLTAFVSAAFDGAAPFLRGIYFASGTQEGTPIDRLTGAMTRVFGIDQARAPVMRPEKGRSYFLGQLLRDVVFGEAMLVREAPGAARRRALLRLAAFAVILVLALGAGVAVALSDIAAEQQVADVAALVARYEAASRPVMLDPVSDGDLRPLIAPLDMALDMADRVPPDRAGFGMGQAAKLDAGARAVYRQALSFGLLPRLIWRLETQIRGAMNRPDQLYEATRIYLMLGGGGPLNAGQVRAWMMQDWEQAYPAAEDADLRTGLLGHLDRLLAQPLPPVTLDTALVTKARAGISRVPLADRVYASIRLSAAAAAAPAWRPVDALGLAGVTVFTRASGAPMTAGIPGFYTAGGFRSVMLPSVDAATRRVAAETWVVGRKTEFAPAEMQDLQAAVARLYFDEFIRQWDRMLDDLNIDAATTLPQAAQALYILASPESPLRALLKSAAAQVQLMPPGRNAPPGNLVTDHYRALIDLATGDGAALERSLRLVADIQQQLAKMAALPIGTAIDPGGENISVALLNDAGRQPAPLSRWLASIGAIGQAQRTGNARRQAALAYNAPNGPARACQAATVNRYPFAASGSALPLDEFARVFGPGGLLDGFFNTQMKPYVDVTGKAWRPQQTGAGAPVSAADVAQFQRAAAIRDAFFTPGQSAPLVQFEIVPPAAETRVVTLSIGGAVIEASRAASHTTQITWPAPGAAFDPGAMASLSVDPGGAPLTESGPWALFRLFSRGRLQPAGRGGRQVLTFSGLGSPISFEIRFAGPVNPFTPGLFNDFHCPMVQ